MKAFIETTDVRDGLYPNVRQILAIMKTETTGEKFRIFRNSSAILQKASKEMGVRAEEIFAEIIDTTSPRCKMPLIDGHGIFGFPPAAPAFSEMRVSSFFKEIMDGKEILDFKKPLLMPIPYTLFAGTIGYCESKSKIPTHNLDEVIDATIALIKNPNIDTKGILQYITGPELLVGGVVENAKDLPSIYETGTGVIQVRVTEDTLNTQLFACVDDLRSFCEWYGMQIRKVRMKDEYRIIVEYNAFLYDGIQERHLSIKEILQSYIDYYREAKGIVSDEVLCEALLKYKEDRSDDAYGGLTKEEYDEGGKLLLECKKAWLEAKASGELQKIMDEDPVKRFKV